MHEQFGLTAQSWNSLCQRIAKNKCVPVVGSRVREDQMPLPEQIAEDWANDRGYPLQQRDELALVAEYVRNGHADDDALIEDFMGFVQQRIPDKPLDLKPGHPLRTLVELPFEMYVTTCYDDLLERALRAYRDDCDPVSISCQWDPTPAREWHPANAQDFYRKPTLTEPLIFHLHGRFANPQSLVLTEMNHLELTSKLHRGVDAGSQTPNEGAADIAGPLRGTPPLLPPEVRSRLASSAWFFIGYGAADSHLRGLLTALNKQVRSSKQAIAVQLQKGHAVEGKEQEADTFLTDYFSRLLATQVEVVMSEAGPFLDAIRNGVDAELARLAAQAAGGAARVGDASADPEEGP